MTDDFERYPLTGWFPGHMFKAGRQMSEALQLVDMVVELVDARAPFFTRNPALRRLLAGKPFQILANKADLASPSASRAWQGYCESQGMPVHFLDSRKKGNIRHLPELWRKLVNEARRARGVTRPLLRPVRIMIAGVPNVGKSTLINHLLDKNKAQVGPKPGVTRTNQWVPLASGVEMLDTPGILWPKVTSKKHELLLALLGILNEDVIPRELVAEYLAWKLQQLGLAVKWGDYGLTEAPRDGDELLAAIAARRAFMRPGGVPDTERAAIAFVKDFRDGNFGRITLEMPPEEPE